MAKPRVVILGAGPAGLGAAYRLARSGRAEVTVLERNGWVGGNTASFDLAGLRVDYGSHRLHPVIDPVVFEDIRALLGDDLLTRPRHGRIRLRGRWIHFPLKPLDLLLRLPPAFAVGASTDLVRRLARTRSDGSADESFATVLEAGLGGTICRDFYFPYARKIWGLAPDQIAATQARRRVSANSPARMLGKLLPFGRRPGAGRGNHFLYPRRGYGQIAEVYCRAAREAGATVHLNARIEAVETSGGAVRSVSYTADGALRCAPADYVWSTIPITVLARGLKPPLPPERLRAAGGIDYRAMLLIYLVLDQDRFSEYDAHYFPELRFPISRLSEPKNFSAGEGTAGVTVLCAELPCDPDDPVWSQTDDALGQLVCRTLEAAGAPVRAPVRQVVTRRLRQAYPIYRRGFERHFEQLDQALGEIQGLLTFGRQGLFSHDNLHHALYMAYCAADCLADDGGFDLDKWQAYRRVFETHVVED